MSFFVLRNQSIKENAKRAIDRAPYGITVLIEEQKKSRMAEMKYHAMIGDIAKQVDLIGERRDVEDAKRLLIDAFARVMAANGTPLRHQSRIIPSLDGSGFVQLGIQSRRFTVSEASEFIEYLYSFGDEHGVVWSETVEVPGWVLDRVPA